MRNYFFTVLTWQNLLLFFANFPVNKQPSTSEVIRRYRSTYEGCALVPLVTSSIGDSELIIHFQESYARLFPNCYNKQGIQSNLPSYTPMNQGTICAKVYPEGIQPIKGNRIIQSLNISELRLGRGNKDNLGIFFHKNTFCDPSLELLLWGHNIVKK